MRIYKHTPAHKQPWPAHWIPKAAYLAEIKGGRTLGALIAAMQEHEEEGKLPSTVHSANNATKRLEAMKEAKRIEGIWYLIGDEVKGEEPPNDGRYTLEQIKTAALDVGGINANQIEDLLFLLENPAEIKPKPTAAPAQPYPTPDDGDGDEADPDGDEPDKEEEPDPLEGIE